MRQRSAFFCLISSFLAFLALPFGTASAADTTPPTVIRLLPEAGASVVELRQIEVFFSEDVQGVDASDLRINGVAATNLSPVTASQYRFAFSQPATGMVQIAWAAGQPST